ncbi:hypothetical protein LO763_22060 [Glycomyces sp. A-F 0318]|uniref:hypothetical protein n=1 Tax=Glycomyces amatae TaxID=2881355 RepID=UPI001E38EDF4|nr:hypothetical protein [Glycomyces amatae]MCD0446302.1 hypothetical protein [Glycomyces amatae]
MELVITHLANFGTDTEPSGYVTFNDQARLQFLHVDGVGLAVLPPFDGPGGPAHVRAVQAALAAAFPAAGA